MLSVIKYPNKLDRPDVNIGIIDNLSVKTEDINGDGCPDYPHGKVVRDILTSNLGFNPTIVEFDTGMEGTIVPEKNITSELKKFKENKDVEYAVMSVCGYYIYDKNKYSYSSKFDLADKLIKNIVNNYPHLKEKIDTLKSITSDGKKLFIPAGNKNLSSKIEDDLVEVDPQSLVDGVISVGSLDKNNKKPEYNFNNPFINKYAKGEYDVTPILENDTHGTVIGYDITEDGVMDVDISEITGYKDVEHFIGEDITNVQATDEDYKTLKRVLRKYYKKGRIVTKNDLSGDALALNSKLFKVSTENYADLLTIINIKNKVEKEKTPTLFLQTEGERVVYNPYKGCKSVTTLKGTSYAAPTALAQVLNEKYGYATHEAVK